MERHFTVTLARPSVVVCTSPDHQPHLMFNAPASSVSFGRQPAHCKFPCEVTSSLRPKTNEALAILSL